MKMLPVYCVFVLMLLPPSKSVATPSAGANEISVSGLEMKDTIRLGNYRMMISYSDDNQQMKKRSKLIAIAADILTGPLGGHRIYLGTEPWVPVVYAFTLGGGMGFLPLADLFVIIFTPDLNRYTDNSQFIMWL
ncbi:MAG: NINE protein [Bacteroidales bacterium]